MPRIADNTISTTGGGVRRNPMLADPRGDGGAMGAALAAGARALDTAAATQRALGERTARNILAEGESRARAYERRGREISSGLATFGRGISAGAEAWVRAMERRAEQEANAAVADYLRNLDLKCNGEDGFFSRDVVSAGAANVPDARVDGPYTELDKWAAEYKADEGGPYARLSDRARRHFDRKTAAATDAARSKAMELQVSRARKASLAAEAAAADQLRATALTYAGSPADFANFAVMGEEYARAQGFIDARAAGCRFKPGSTAGDFRLADEADRAIYDRCVAANMAKVKAQGVKALLDTAVDDVDDDSYAEQVFSIVGNLVSQGGYTRREYRAAIRAAREGGPPDEVRARAEKLMVRQQESFDWVDFVPKTADIA